MTPLSKELDLFYDGELNSSFKRLDEGTVESYENLVRALNLRAMINLAGKYAKEGVEKFPTSKKLYYELILAGSVSSETLAEVEKVVKNSPLKNDERLKIFSLLLYYKDDAKWCEILKEVKVKDEIYYELSGHKYREKGDFESALKAYSTASSINPTDPRLSLYKIETLKTLQKKDEFLKEITILLKGYEYFIGGWNYLARHYLEEEKLSLAYQAIGKALSINPNDWGAFFALADYYLNKKAYGRARGLLEILLSFEPTKWIVAEIYNYLGYLFFLENRLVESQYYLEKALEKNPELAEAWYNLGNLFFHKKSFSEALSCYENAAASDEKMAQAFTQIGLTLLEMGKFSQSLKPLKKALEIDSSEYFAHLGLAEYYRKTKDVRRALDHALMALKLQPLDPNVHNILGTIYEFKGDYKKAEESYKEALKVDPMYRWAANNLGYLYEKLMKNDVSYKKLAIDAWKKRLFITIRTGSSIKGAVNHLLKLGVKSKAIKQLIDKARM